MCVCVCVCVCDVYGAWISSDTIFSFESLLPSLSLSLSLSSPTSPQGHHNGGSRGSRGSRGSSTGEAAQGKPQCVRTLLSGMPLTWYPHLRHSLHAVSPASTPVFIGNTLSNPKSFVTYSSYSPSTSLWNAREVSVSFDACVYAAQGR